MPNVENINKAIAVMERVKKHEQELGRRLFDLRSFQGRDGKTILRTALKTEKGVLNHCGTTCCMAGWLAVSPEFRELGFKMHNDGMPGNYIDNTDPEYVLADIFGVGDHLVFQIIYNYHATKINDSYFGKESEDVTIDEVIEALKSLMIEDNNANS